MSYRLLWYSENQDGYCCLATKSCSTVCEGFPFKTKVGSQVYTDNAHAHIQKGMKRIFFLNLEGGILGLLGQKWLDRARKETSWAFTEARMNDPVPSGTCAI